MEPRTLSVTQSPRSPTWGFVATRVARGEGSSTTAGFRALYGTFAPTWEVKPATSLFTYPSGKSTRSYQVAGFPSQVATDIKVLPGLSPPELTKLEGTCRRAGITNGALLDDCLLDTAEIGIPFAALLATLAADIGAFAEPDGHHLRPTGPGPSPTPPPTTTTTAPAPTSGPVAKYFQNPCLLLTVAQADAATHLSYGSPGSLPEARECIYAASQESSEFTFILSQGPVTMSPQFAPGTPVASLGHGALWGTPAAFAAGYGELDFSLGLFSGAQYAVKLLVFGGGETRAVALARAMLDNVG